MARLRVARLRVARPRVARPRVGRRRHLRRHTVPVAVVLPILGVLTTPAVLRPPAPTAAAVASRPPPGPVYHPPVEAPIIDRFRPPACSWCPGNRGIDYAVAPGTPVRA